MPADRPGEAVLSAHSVHFIGIAGTGMQALAEVLLARGIRISGSDARSSPALDSLAAAGAITFVGQRAEQIGDAEAIVISAAVPDDNAELREARRRGSPIATHAQVLGALSRQMNTIAVAGTAGKSTTTALTAHILAECGRDPVVLGGAFAPNLGGSGRAGKGNIMVVEADEFARRFLELSPHIAVITNIEPDHLDYYGSFAAIETAFAEFVGRMHSDGTLLACADESMDQRIIGDPRRRSYGEAITADWRMSNYQAGSYGIRFDVQTPNGETLAVSSLLRGRHNALNATAAIAAASLSGVSPDSAAQAAASFVGTQRRFETILQSDSLWIVDDYAHHPTKIRATLRAAREIHPGRIWAVFQPHTSHRTRTLFHEFTTAFEDADQVLVLPIYHPAGREAEPLEITNDELARFMSHQNSRSVASMDSTVELLMRERRPGDLILLMGAGDVTDLGPRLAAELEAAR
jgi:UDP-N-acetylmuramate--alanine ligase